MTDTLKSAESIRDLFQQGLTIKVSVDFFVSSTAQQLEDEELLRIAMVNNHTRIFIDLMNKHLSKYTDFVERRDRLTYLFNIFTPVPSDRNFAKEFIIMLQFLEENCTLSNFNIEKIYRIWTLEEIFYPAERRSLVRMYAPVVIRFLPLFQPKIAIYNGPTDWNQVKEMRLDYLYDRKERAGWPKISNVRWNRRYVVNYRILMHLSKFCLFPGNIRASLEIIRRYLYYLDKGYDIPIMCHKIHTFWDFKTHRPTSEYYFIEKTIPKK